MKSLTLKALETFSGDRYATQLTGVKIELVEPFSARCSLTIEEHHRNAMGSVMGGVMFTLADFTFAVAANSACLADDSPIQWVSTNSNIHYLSQPQGNRLSAQAECLKQGKNSCLFQIRILDDNDRLTAVVTTEGRRIK